MGCQLLFAGTDDARARTRGVQTADRCGLLAPAAVAVGTFTGHGQIGLPASHRQVDVGEDLRVEQGAVQFAVGVVDAVTFAQRIEAVALARMTLARHHQGIEHRAVIAHVGAFALPQQGELVVDEANVERRVVNDQLGALDELVEFIGDFPEARLVGHVFVGDAVNRDGAFVDLAIGLR